MNVKNAWLFVVLAAAGYLGVSYFNLIIWANIIDVIDDVEVKTGKREDGTVYAVYSFARKVGQALAGGLGGYALGLIGYVSTAKTPVSYTHLGANGCGKSTLFSLMTKNLYPRKGKIFLGGKNIQNLGLKDFAKKVSIVHQYNTSSDDITVERLVSYGRTPHMKMMQAKGEEDDRLVEWAMEVTNLSLIHISVRCLQPVLL